MRISTRLALAALAPPLVAVLIGLALRLSLRQIGQAQQRGRAAQQIVHKMHELDGLAYSYLLHHDERPRVQFLMEHDAVARLLGAVRPGNSSQQQLLESMRRNSGSVRGSFLKLVSNAGRVAGAGNDPLFREADERLAGRLLTRSRAVVSDALRLQNLMDDEIAATQRTTNAFVLLLILAATAPLTLGLVHMMRGITESLTVLREGTEIIGAGSLGHRIGMAAPDELGDLARSFDRMAERLQAVTVSRNELQQEVEERKRAEAELGQAYERLQAQSEELQAQQEEMASANEELQAQQEELASANEELRAQQEGLAAANEGLRESEERFRVLTEASPDLIWLHTTLPQGRTDYVNPAWQEFTGLTLDALNRDGWEQVEHPEDREALGAAWAEAEAKGEPFEAEFRYRRRRGEYCWFWGRAAPVKDGSGRISKWIGVARDITERRQAEDALREADRRKDEFLAMLSHELRSPLAAISNAAQLLQRRGLTDPSLQRACAAASRQTQHMARLLDDLLDVSRITRGKVVLRQEDVELLPVIESAIEASSPLIEGNGHRLLVSVPHEAMQVRGDPVRLAQVVSNLLNNAAKYTPPGGEIRLALQWDDSDAIIRVSDNGIGIPPETLPHVFDLFVQGDTSPGRGQSGLGIGLTMVRSLVEMHGGRVTARSAGKGSEFVIRLPMLNGTRSSEGADQTPEPCSPIPARRILVVDDNADAAELLAMMLEMDGHEVATAHSGPTALEAVAGCRPDVVLLDIGMPGMDGCEVARRLRQDEALAAVRLVALTGYGQEEDRERTASAGFDHHLVKPVDMGALRDVLRPAPSC